MAAHHHHFLQFILRPEIVRALCLCLYGSAAKEDGGKHPQTNISHISYCFFVVAVLLVPELYRRHAEMILDVFPEERRVGESHLVADLFDAIVGLLQIVADILQYMFGNPVVGRATRLFLTDGREVFGRDAEFGGIPFHRMVFHLDGVQQVEEPLEVAAGRTCIGLYHIRQETLFQGTAESEDGCAQQRLDDVGAERMVSASVETQPEHFVEVGVELYVIVLQRDEIESADIDDIVPYRHLLMQETLQDAVGEEHRLEIEVGTDHRVGDGDILWNNGHLVLVQFHRLAVQRALYLSPRADDDGVHRHMGGTDLGKLLDTVDDDNIVVGIADLDVLIVG